MKNKKDQKKVKELPLTDEEISEGTDAVMFPEQASIPVRFVGKEFRMRPLPITHAKRVSKLCKPLMAKFAESAVAQETAKAPLNQDDLDEEAIDVLMEVAGVLLRFYDLTSFIPTMEDTTSVSSLYEFVSAQMRLNEANDFLLRSCRMLLKFVEVQVLAETRIEQQMIQETT